MKRRNSVNKFADKESSKVPYEKPKVIAADKSKKSALATCLAFPTMLGAFTGFENYSDNSLDKDDDDDN